MKTRNALLCLMLLCSTSAFTQGRVVINEYLPWPINACAVTSEFIELTNMGPGPMNIGCWVLTDGDFSITIPPNTIIKPGQFFVISGQDSLPIGCGNIAQAIKVDLNWNSCGCTSAPIPTTGDGFLTDGGSANEQLVLLDDHLNLIDAIVRNLPAETNSTVNTAATGTCSSKTFNLNNYTVNYETVGESAGRGNSFARRLDGDCGWLKDTQQSGGSTNNTPGEASTLTSSLTITQSQSCTLNGSISVLLSGTGSLFPVTYILAQDLDEDGIFETTDSYMNGLDASGPSVEIGGLAPGSYRVVITPASGCSQVGHSFRIFDCTMGVLDRVFSSFTLLNNGAALHLNWRMTAAPIGGSFRLEKSLTGQEFTVVSTFNCTASLDYRISEPLPTPICYYRLVYTLDGVTHYSNILKASNQPDVNSWALRGIHATGVTGTYELRIENAQPGSFEIRVISALGSVLQQKTVTLGAGWNQVEIKALRGGFVELRSLNRTQPVGAASTTGKPVIRAILQ